MHKPQNMKSKVDKIFLVIFSGFVLFNFICMLVKCLFTYHYIANWTPLIGFTIRAFYFVNMPMIDAWYSMELENYTPEYLDLLIVFSATTILYTGSFCFLGFLGKVLIKTISKFIKTRFFWQYSRYIIASLLSYLIVRVVFVDISLSIKALVIALIIFMSYILIRNKSLSSKNKIGFYQKVLLTVMLALSMSFIWTLNIWGRKHSVIYSIVGGTVSPAISYDDKVLIKKTKQIRRGDIVIFKAPAPFPPYATPPSHIAGRVVACENDLVETNGNRLIINGKEMLEPYANIGPPYWDWTPRRIPERHYFILLGKDFDFLGSHRFGPVPIENIYGKVIKIYRALSLYHDFTIRDWFKFLIGILIILFSIIGPIFFYLKMRPNNFLKLLVFYHEFYWIIAVLLMCYHLIFITEGATNSWTTPIAYTQILINMF